MGQTNGSQRLHHIRHNVSEVREKIRSENLSLEERNRSHDILIDYIKEMKYILSKSTKSSAINEVEKLIITALEELADLEGNLKTVEPRLKAKSMQKLHEIDKNLKSISANFKFQNLELEKENIEVYKKRISMIDGFDDDVEVTKSKLLETVSSVESTFTELEIEEKLRKIEEQHSSRKVDLKRFVGVSESESYKKLKTHLVSLRDEAYKVSEVTPKIKQLKNYVIFNIDNNISALDSKVKENENSVTRKIKEDICTISERPIESVLKAFSKFEQHFSGKNPSEVEEVVRELERLKRRIEQKLDVLKSQIRPESHGKVSMPVAPPRVLTRINDIEKEVRELKEQITSCKYTEESYIYKKFHEKLRDCKRKLEKLTVVSLEDKEYLSSVFEFRSRVENLLGNFDRSYDDVFIDVVSISNSVNELGRSIQGRSLEKSEDFEAVRRDLSNFLDYLKIMEIPNIRSNVCEFRDYLLIQIEGYLANLQRTKPEEVLVNNDIYGI